MGNRAKKIGTISGMIIAVSIFATLVFYGISFYQQAVFESHNNSFASTPEAQDCLKWGGGWVSGENTTGYCDNPRSVKPDQYGLCPEGYVTVSFNRDYGGVTMNCFTQEYHNSAKCDKYWYVIWDPTGYGCHRMNQEQIDSVKIDEILENQKKILDSLQEAKRSPENLSNSSP